MEKKIILQGLLCDVGWWDDTCLGIKQYPGDADFYKNHPERELLAQCRSSYDEKGKDGTPEESHSVNLPHFCDLVVKTYGSDRKIKVSYYHRKGERLTADTYVEEYLKSFYGDLDTEVDDHTVSLGLWSAVTDYCFRLGVGGHSLNGELLPHVSRKDSPTSIVFIIEILDHA